MSDAILTDNSTDSIGAYVQQLYHEFSDGASRVLYSLNLVQGASRYLTQIGAAIQTIQVIGILFAVHGSVALVPWSQIHARPVVLFCSLFTETLLDVVGLGPAAFQIALSLVALLLGGGVAIGWLIQQNNQIPVLMEIYSALANLMVSVLFLPTTRVLVVQVLTGTSLSLFLGVVALVPMLLFAIAYISAVFDTNPLSKSVVARSQTRIDAFSAVSKVLLVVVSISSQNAFLLTILAFAASLIVSYLFTMYLPLYDYRMMQYQAALSWIFTWASLSAIVASVYNNDASGGAVFMFIGGIPVVVLSSYLVVQGRVDHLRTIPIAELKNAWEVQIRFRIAVQDVDQSATKAAVLQQHKVREVARDSDADPKDVVLDLADREGRRSGAADFNECKSILVVSLKRFPDSVHLLLAAAMFHVEIVRIFFLAYLYLDQVVVLDPKFDQRWLHYRIQRTIQDRIFESESNTEVVQYNIRKDLLERAQNLDLRIVQATIEFWTHVLKPKPDEDRMRELAVQISNESKTAYSSYAKAIGISDDSVSSLQSYSGFLLTIMRDGRSGGLLLERAQELQQTKAKSKQTSVFKDLLFDDRAAVFFISGNMQNLGIIIDCNLRAAQLIGYSKSILLGKNIRILLPEPFASSHDSLLMRNMEHGIQKRIDMKNNLIILHQNGYVHDIVIFVKAFVKDLTTLCFIGVVEAINPDVLLILYDRTGVITAISHTVSLQLGVEKERVDSHDVHIGDVIAEVESHYAAYRKAIASSPDYIRVFTHEQDGVQYQMASRFQTVAMLDDDFAVIMRIDILGKQGMAPAAFAPSALVPDEFPASISGIAEDSDAFRDSRSDRSGERSRSDGLESNDAGSGAENEPAVSQSPVDRVSAFGSAGGDVNDGDDSSPNSIDGDALEGPPAASPDHDDDGADHPNIEPFYPNATAEPTTTPSGRSRRARARPGSKLQSRRESDDSLPSATSNANGANATDTDANNNAIQKKLEQVLMKWLHRAFIIVFMLLAVLSLGQVFVANSTVTSMMSVIAISNFSGEFAMDVLRIADIVRDTDLIARGLIPDPDHALAASHLATIARFVAVAKTGRDSILEYRSSWDDQVMGEMSAPYQFSFCTDAFTAGCLFDTTTLAAMDMFIQLAHETSSVPPARLDLLDQNSVRFIIDNVQGLTEISNRISALATAAATDYNNLANEIDLADLLLQIASAAFLFLYAIRATIIGVQLRNDEALVTVFHVPRAHVNNILTPYSDRLSILQMTDIAESSDIQDARTETSSNVFIAVAKQKSSSDSSKKKRLKRLEAQVRKTSKFKTKRLLRYILKFGQLAVLYAIFFTYRRIGVSTEGAHRAPLPVRFQYGWRSGSLLRRALFNTRELLLESADLLLSRDAANNTAAWHALIQDDIGSAESQRSALTFGGVLDDAYYPGCLNSGPGHFDLEFSNVCNIPAVAASAGPTCDTFLNGIGRGGRQALVAEQIRIIPLFISDMDTEIARIQSDPAFVPGVAARDSFLRNQLQSAELRAAFRIDNGYLGELCRYFCHLLTSDRARIASDRMTLGYTLIAMVVIINIYGYVGVVMTGLKDIAREFTQTQDLLKFVPAEIRHVISRDVRGSRSKHGGGESGASSWIAPCLSAVTGQLRRLPLLSTGLVFGAVAVSTTLFTNPAAIWTSTRSNPGVAAVVVVDCAIASWTPFGFGLILKSLIPLSFILIVVNVGTQIVTLWITAIMNAILGQPIDWTLAIWGIIGAICGNLFSKFLVEGIFQRGLVTLFTLALYITHSLAMGIAQRYLSAKTFKRIENITGVDHIDVLVFGVTSGIFSILNGSSSGAFLFLMADCYFQLHFSVALPTCILIGAIDSALTLGLHTLMGIRYADFSSASMLNLILPLIFIFTPVLCYLNAKFQGRYFKEYMVVLSVFLGVFLSSWTQLSAAWTFIYIFVCTLAVWLPVCASIAVGGTIRSAAFDDI